MSSAGSIEVTVPSPDVLFEWLDPITGAVRHLSEHVEDFIVHRAKETPSARYELLIRISVDIAPGTDAARLGEGVSRHFVHRSAEESGRIRRLVREGLRDLLIGLVFLFLCAAIALTAARVLPAPVGLFVEQGLLILGWVALWRPADLLLYEIRPVRLQRDLMEKLARAEVHIKPAQDAVPSRPTS